MTTTDSEGPYTAIRQAFSMPKRVAASDVQLQALAGAQRTVLDYDGVDLACWSLGSGPRVVLAHGWNSRGAHLSAFIAPLVAAGYSVTLLDFPGHGESGDAASSVVHMGRALLFLCQSLGEIHGVIGHSAGAGAALWAFHHGLEVTASVHLNGPSSLSPMVHGMAAGFGLDAAQAQAFHNWVEGFIEQPVAAADLPILKRGLRHPGLIIHDADDKVVPFAAAEALNAAWAESVLIQVSGLGHSKVLLDPQVVALSVSFIAGNRAACQAHRATDA
ncbi:alpha/beta fold hydrolase [Pseudomonas sp.]|uniref:alpha/beta fold hydrolase n=1 Tax=Pseudomonas sp. TaxID=306 RepID=UPI003D0CAAAF